MWMSKLSGGVSDEKGSGGTHLRGYMKGRLVVAYAWIQDNEGQIGEQIADNKDAGIEQQCSS